MRSNKTKNQREREKETENPQNRNFNYEMVTKWLTELADYHNYYVNLKRNTKNSTSICIPTTKKAKSLHLLVFSKDQENKPSG